MEEPIPSEYHPMPKSAGLCVLPQSSPQDSTITLSQNILLNSYFGVKTIFLYSNSVTHKLIKVITEAEKGDSLLSVRILPWNVPFEVTPELLKKFVTQDCLLRTRRTLETKLVLEPHQILVPKSSLHISSVVKKAGSFQVEIDRFCEEFPSEASSAKNTYSIPALEQTTFDKSLSGNYVNIFHNLEKVGDNKSDQNEDEQTNILDRTRLVVFDFSPCQKFDFQDEDSVKDLRIANLKDSIEKQIGSHFPLKSV